MARIFCNDGFWNETLFRNLKYPIFTECFQYSLLLITAVTFDVLFVVFVIMKFYNANRIIKIPFDLWYIAKLTFHGLLLIFLIAELLFEQFVFKYALVLDGVCYIAFGVLCVTLVLVMLLTEIRRRTMHPVCPILFIFWFTGTLTYLIRFYCNIVRLVYKIQNTKEILFLLLSGVILFVFILNLIIDCCSRYSIDRIVIKKAKPCPEEYASIISKLTYSWLDKYMYRWYKQEMTDENSFDLRREDESTRNTNLVEKVFLDKICQMDKKHKYESFIEVSSSSMDLLEEKKEIIDNKNPGWILFLSLMKIFSPELFLGWLFKISNDILIFSMPFLLRILLQYFDDKTNSTWFGYVLAFTFLISGTMSSVAENVAFFTTSCLSNKIQAAIIGMVYRKTLRLNNEVRSKFTCGEIVNLMSVDAERIMNWVVFSWFITSCPLQFIMAILLLYQQLGYAIFSGVGLIIAFFPMQWILMHFLQKYSAIELKWKDERIKILTEILNGIKVLKMYAWENSFLAKASHLRDTEMKYIVRASVGWGIFSVVWEILPFLIMLVTFVTYVFMDRTNIITAENAFVSLAVFNLLRFPMVVLPWGLTDSVNAFVSLKRIGAYLVGEELDKSGIQHFDDSTGQRWNDDVVVEISDGRFSWKKDERVILNKIDFEITRGKLIAVVGKVGTGKSSLISAILGEMHRLNGSVKIRGKLAYVSQEAWIQNKSLKNNVLFTNKYDETFYNKVLEACSLKPDLEQLPAGDATEIGERGINLSGGQKQRVSLARAVYQNRDIYLLDDPLSAVDAHVGQHLFDNVISNNGILQGKTRILVTHGLNWLPKVDEVFVLDSNGSISERGSFKELLKNGNEFMQFIQDYLAHSDSHTDTDKTIEDVPNLERAKSLLRNVSESDQAVDEFTNLVSSSPSNIPFIRHLSSESKPVDNRDAKQRRKSSDLMSPQVKYFEAANREVFSEEDPTKLPSSAADDNLEDHESFDKIGLNRSRDPESSDEHAMSGTVNIGTYMMYIRSRGLKIFIATILIYVVASGLEIYNNVWLKQFTEDGIIQNASSLIAKNKSYIPEMSSIIRERTEYYMTRYSLIGVGMFLAILFYWIGFTIGTLNAAKTIHQTLLRSILHSSMQFFDTTPSGRILNRFSRDIEQVDHIIPMNISDAFNCFILILASITVIVYATPWFGVVIIPLGIFYYFIQMFYLPTSRQARRLDSISTSPIFSHFTETLQGVSVIRAFKEQNYFQKLNQRLIDKSSKFKFIQYSSIRWLSLRIDGLGNLVVFTAILFAIIDRAYITASLVGLSISYSLQITEALNWCLRQYTELETNSVSLERIREYSMVPGEAEWNKDNSPPGKWPTAGHVKFVNYDLRYRPNLPLVLKKINLHLKAGEKIGVVGRTGAGKSSLNLALFRLVESSGGTITIDNVDISTLGLHDLRRNLTILPQDPVIFSGTLRENLDPFQKHTENELFQSLETAHLKEWVSNLSEGMDYECGEGGANLSAGQKQLLCLARALLRKSKVLILDEATASVDVETDRLVMQTIRDCFRSSTVIIIAHRINTIIDADKIVVMDNGRIIEMDSPQNLLATPGSLFKSLAEQSTRNSL